MAMHEDIKALLEKHGPMGVNALQRELKVPLSTIHKYLDKQQNYFIKTESRRWDLPERHVNPIRQLTGTNSGDSVSTIIDSQLVGMQATYELLTQQISTILNLAVSLKPSNNSTPVAKEDNGEVSKEWSDLYSQVSRLPGIFKSKKENLTPDQLELLLNVKWHSLVLNIGTKAFAPISDHLADLALGQETEIRDEIADLLVTYLKES